VVVTISWCSPHTSLAKSAFPAISEFWVMGFQAPRWLFAPVAT
jgi:hypothetical protein